MPDETAPGTGQDNTATVQGTPPAQPAGNTTPPAAPAPTAQESAPAPASEKPAQPAGFNSILSQEAKPAESAEGGGKDNPPEPTDFDLKLPDGVEADTEAITGLKEVAREGKLSQVQAQKLLDLHEAARRRDDERRIALGMKQIEAWEKEITTHPEFGGANLDRNLEGAKLMLQKYGTPRLMKEFKEMGVLSHPDFAFMLMKMHKDVSEGVSIGGAGQAMPERSAAEVLFGNDVK